MRHKTNEIIISLSIVLLTIAHYLTPVEFPLWHDLYRRLYYLPIIYAAFIFGARGGVIAAVAVSFVFLPHVIHRWGQISLQTYDALLEMIIYLAVANITGTLVELQQKKNLEISRLREEIAMLVAQSLIKPTTAKTTALPKNPELHFDFLIGETKVMQQIYNIIDKSSATDINVLIFGESGTGKELVARAIHNNGKRRANKFMAINCAAIPETLLESELFGYKKGAFTGAEENKPGKFVLADGGTLFLDEIGTMSPPLQAKLLRVLQDQEVQPLGSAQSIKVNVRLIAATNENIEMKIKHHQFREDLYYRLNVLSLTLPPLRQRQEDIQLLATYLLKKYNAENITISTETLKILRSYGWPGNIRELENVIQRAIALNQGTALAPQDLPEHFHAQGISIGSTAINIPDEGLDIVNLEKELIIKALEKSAGNQTRAAKLLKLSRPTLLYRMEKFNLK